MTTHTHTYVVLEVSKPAYDEIKSKLVEAQYQHAFEPTGEIDMHGIALQSLPPVPPAKAWHHHVDGPDLFYCPNCRCISNVPVFCNCFPDRLRVLPIALAQKP